ncbi:MAG: hypothetical protein A2Z28_01440 [Chloroflexi bacterium RBG_16_51_9]|nr:MAG: hypothetical protein A2Z28_01440 [Chloroflexi bacterium RBG_16_51_9]
MPGFDFSHQTDNELLATYSELMEELRQRQVIRTNNNPVADYAEKVAIESLNLSAVGKEQKGFDAVDRKGRKYQIKGRRLTRHNSSRQLGVIRNLDERLFDYLIAVIFDEAFGVKEIWQIPQAFVTRYATLSQHQNGHIFFADPNTLTTGKGVTRIL